jgi:hypothetical protein
MVTSPILSSRLLPAQLNKISRVIYERLKTVRGFLPLFVVFQFCCVVFVVLPRESPDTTFLIVHSAVRWYSRRYLHRNSRFRNVSKTRQVELVRILRILRSFLSPNRYSVFDGQSVIFFRSAPPRFLSSLCFNDIRLSVSTIWGAS